MGQDERGMNFLFGHKGQITKELKGQPPLLPLRVREAIAGKERE